MILTLRRVSHAVVPALFIVCANPASIFKYVRSRLLLCYARVVLGFYLKLKNVSDCALVSLVEGNCSEFDCGGRNEE